jgi:hypothetical protein
MFLLSSTSWIIVFSLVSTSNILPGFNRLWSRKICVHICNPSFTFPQTFYQNIHKNPNCILLILELLMKNIRATLDLNIINLSK